jgi:chromosome segregation ATPase
MSTSATNVSTPSSTPQARRYRHLESELKFCRWALLRGNSLAAQGQLESATKELWLVEDAAEAMESVIARIDDADKLDAYQKEVAQLRRELCELRMYLCIPPVADYKPISH